MNKHLPTGARTAPKPRFHELDGLRGWASVQVVLFHLVVQTFSGLFPQWDNPVTAVIFNGHLAVCIFFVLSGEALSIGTVAGAGPRSATSILLKRYTRLTIPVAASCLVVLAVVHAGLAFNAQAGRVVGSLDWLALFLSNPQPIAGAIKYMAADVYFGSDAASALNPFLWTMQYEMLGSMIVLLVALAWPQLRQRGALAVLAFLVLQPSMLGSHLALFLVGMGFAWLRSRGWFEQIRERSVASAVAGASVILIAVVDGLIRYHKFPGALRVDQFVAILLCLGLFCNRTSTWILRSGPSRFLGFISFPLFLVQFPVIISVTSALILRASANGVLDERSAGVIAAASFFTCLAFAMAFTPVESFAARVGKWIVQTFQEREHVHA